MHNVTTAKTTFRYALALTLLLSGACYPFAHRQAYPAKQVTGKEGISVLRSTAARCLVPTKDFPKVQVGMMWECDWHDTPEITGTSSQRVATPK